PAAVARLPPGLCHGAGGLAGAAGRGTAGRDVRTPAAVPQLSRRPGRQAPGTQTRSVSEGEPKPPRRRLGLVYRRPRTPARSASEGPRWRFGLVSRGISV